MKLITDAENIRRFADRIVSKNPELNILINDAGVMRYEDAIVSLI